MIVIFLIATGSTASSETEAPMNTDEHFRRHLETTSAETFAHWTGDRSKNVIPLDLKLRSSDYDGSAYLAGHGNYAQFFVQGGQDNSSTEVEEGDEIVRSRHLLDAKVIVLNDVTKANVEGANSSVRRSHKLEQASSKGLRGQQQHQRNGKQARHMLARHTISLESISFTDAAASFHPDADAQDYELPSSLSGRELKRNRKDRDSNGMREETVSVNKKKEEETSNRKEQKAMQKGMKRPQIISVSPPQGAGVKGSQAFTIVAEPSPATNAPITYVLFQIIDPQGTPSSWIEVPQIGTNRYQLTIDGFTKHKSTKWTYQVLVKDASGKEGTTGAITVFVNGIGDTNDRFVDDTSSFTAPPPSPSFKSPPAASQAMRREVVSDENWSQGGVIQLATGKILFEFRGQGDFVCSGTVVMDGSNGSSPNARNGRSIVQTAAHCVYNDINKEFATKAMFIPDQVSTKASSSNTNCNDDKLGCWKLSFGVVAQGWAESQFPDNVGFDYAYYVVYDDPSTTHSGGYLRGISGILDRDVTPVKIDFDYSGKDFTYALGYSSDHDPYYRYCSMDQDTIYGVSWYQNLWLDQCGLGSGASGGPWISNMDENGVGTLFSINSWGFDDKTGMAGPSLRTQDGSLAECLFQQALNAPDPGQQGGYVVSC